MEDRMTPAPPRPSLAALQRQVDEVQADLTAHRAELAREVRTRRFVVTDDSGTDRVVVVVGASHTALTVLAPPRADGQVHATAELIATEGETEDNHGRPTAYAMVITTANGENGATLQATE